MSNEQRLLKYAVYINKCSSEALKYGRCVAEKSERITKSACEKEFLEFFACFKRQFTPPFRILIDGTFAMAALVNKINLREQVPKYLSEESIICVTPCVLAELEKLGSQFYGALHICQQFQVEKCPHKPVRSASDCICRLARRMERKRKYFIATQDSALTNKLRDIPGVPILFIKYKGILIDRASEATMQAVENSKSDLNEMKALKKEVLGVEEKRKKSKRAKGPNPLSVKKKKRLVVQKQTGVKTTTGKRRRKKKANKVVSDQVQ